MSENQTSPTPSSLTLSFEEALSELEAIVDRLEAGDVSLDDAISSYARGMTLKQHCQQRLEEARLRVEKIKLSEDGSIAGSETFATDSA